MRGHLKSGHEAGSLDEFAVADITVQPITTRSTKLEHLPQPNHLPRDRSSLCIIITLVSFIIFFPFLMSNIITNAISHPPFRTNMEVQCSIPYCGQLLWPIF